MNSDWFSVFRTIAFIFATLMLVKYYIFLMLAPFYPVKEGFRKLRMRKRLLRHPHIGPYKPKISVIVPAWNEEVGIIKTITSILKNKYKNIELIVVNDGSTDKSDRLIRDFIATHRIGASRIKYYYKPNGGKGRALNFGIKQSSGDIIMTIDADSIIDSRALGNLVKYFADDTISAVVGNVKVAKNYTIIGLLQQLEYLFGFYFKRAHAVMGAEYIFGGACAAYRREVFTELGLFDEKNKTEDIEMSLRIRFFGHNCTYGEDVVCYTEGASNIKGLINQRLRWKKGRFDTFIKYRRLFFSLSKHHNYFLAFFILPFSMLAELQLFFEPIAIALLITYSIVSGDFLSITLGSLFIFTIYLVNAFFSHEGLNLKLLILFFFTWPLFYLLVWIEYIALLKSSKMLIRGDDIEWQKWQRTGVET